MVQRLREICWQVWLPVTLIALWWVLSWDSESLYFPALKNILAEFNKTWLFEHSWSDALPSIIRLLMGFFIALLGGIGLGVLLGLNDRLESAVRPLIDFIRSTPSTALLPLFMLFLGTGQEMKIAMIAFVAIWPILLNTVDGIRAVEPTLRSVAKSFHIRKRHQILHILLPSASPQIFAGARVGLAIGVIAMVVSEMVGRPGGIGYFILNAQRQFDMTAMWGGLVALGILGFFINFLFKFVERRALAWHKGMQNRHKEG
jgi:ABC-type nitrate/sulfonate/bicarbonate transport system permease component